LVRGDLTTENDARASSTEQDAALAAFGLVLDRPPEPDHDTFYLWPELVPAMRMWHAVQTQWRVSIVGAVAAGMGAVPVAGCTGLDYAGVEIVMRRRGIRGAAADEMFGLLQAMERAALDVWAERRSKA
jgi:hypothetical protein